MKTLKSQSIKTKKRILKLILTLVITLIAIPAISMIDADPVALVTDSCVGCGACLQYTNSFAWDAVHDKAVVKGTYVPEEVKAAQGECPAKAILTSW